MDLVPAAVRWTTLGTKEQVVSDPGFRLIISTVHDQHMAGVKGYLNVVDG